MVDPLATALGEFQLLMRLRIIVAAVNSRTNFFLGSRLGARTCAGLGQFLTWRRREAFAAERGKLECRMLRDPRETLIPRFTRAQSIDERRRPCLGDSGRRQTEGENESENDDETLHLFRGTEKEREMRRELLFCFVTLLLICGSEASSPVWKYEWWFCKGDFGDGTGKAVRESLKEWFGSRHTVPELQIDDLFATGKPLKSAALFVGSHAQGKSMLAERLADEILYANGRRAKSCPRGDFECQVRRGKVVVAASAVTSEDWLLEKVADATARCPVAVVVIDDLGIGTDATLRNCVNAVQKLLSGAAHFMRDGKEETVRFNGFIFLTSNDYALEAADARNAVELCFVKTKLTALAGSEIPSDVLSQAQKCLEPLKKTIDEHVNRIKSGKSSVVINDVRWVDKIEFIMFPLLQPCKNFRSLARKTWRETGAKGEFTEEQWEKVKQALRANCTIEDPDMCCYATGNVMAETQKLKAKTEL